MESLLKYKNIGFIEVKEGEDDDDDQYFLLKEVVMQNQSKFEIKKYLNIL